MNKIDDIAKIKDMLVKIEGKKYSLEDLGNSDGSEYGEYLGFLGEILEEVNDRFLQSMNDEFYISFLKEILDQYQYIEDNFDIVDVDDHIEWIEK